MCLRIQTELCSAQKINSNLNISEIFSIIYIERLRKEEKINRVNAVLKDLKSDSSQPFMREVPLRILVRLKSRFVGGSAASLNISEYSSSGKNIAVRRKSRMRIGFIKHLLSCTGERRDRFNSCCSGSFRGVA